MNKLTKKLWSLFIFAYGLSISSITQAAPPILPPIIIPPLVLPCIILGTCDKTPPVVVPKTFTAGTKAVAADVNANFTALKKGINRNDKRIDLLESGVVSIHASQFSASISSASCILIKNANYSYFSTTSTLSSCFLMGGVQLPQGSVVKELSCDFYDKTGSDLKAIFRRSNNKGGSNEIFKSPDTTGTVAAGKYETVTDASPATAVDELVIVDNTKYSYNIYVTLGDSSTNNFNARLMNCKVKYLQ